VSELVMSAQQPLSHRKLAACMLESKGPSQAAPPSHCTNLQTATAIYYSSPSIALLLPAACYIYRRWSVYLTNDSPSIGVNRPAITILQQNSDTIMASAVTNQPAEQNPDTPNGVCGDWCMTSSLLCLQPLLLPK
jgi:hypothetical protein